MAEAITAPSLIISQLKITSSNGQFITLYNPTSSPLDMSKYQLQYFNNYDITKATSSKLIPLAGSLPSHGYYSVNDSSLMLCYQMIVDSASLGLSSTAGMVEVVNIAQSSPGSSVSSGLQDYVAWSKTSVSGAQTLPANTSAYLMRQPLDQSNNPIVSAPGNGTWQAVIPDSGNPCRLLTFVTNGQSSALPTGMPPLLGAPNLPDGVIEEPDVPEDSVSAPGPSYPEADFGLLAPAITELLPNPLGTGNDNSAEFIELYNPNQEPFDLSGFRLQTGKTAVKTYTFPPGTVLEPLSYDAFYSSVTRLSLNNSGSSARLYDPLGTMIGAAADYGTAADGQAWAYAAQTWQWTTRPTPGDSNVIVKPITMLKPAKATRAKAAAPKSSAKPKKVAAIKKTAKKKPKAVKSTPASYKQEAPQARPIHTGTLALIGGAALLYGAYEYRYDLGNRYHKLRSYFRARQAGGQ